MDEFPILSENDIINNITLGIAIKFRISLIENQCLFSKRGISA